MAFMKAVIKVWVLGLKRWTAGCLRHPGSLMKRSCSQTRTALSRTSRPPPCRMLRPYVLLHPVVLVGSRQVGILVISNRAPSAHTLAHRFIDAHLEPSHAGTSPAKTGVGLPSAYQLLREVLLSKCHMQQCHRACRCFREAFASYRLGFGS